MAHGHGRLRGRGESRRLCASRFWLKRNVGAGKGGGGAERDDLGEFIYECFLTERLIVRPEFGGRFTNIRIRLANDLK